MAKIQKNSLENMKIYFIAAEIGNLGVVKHQIEMGLVDINRLSCDGHSALHLAAMSGNHNLMQYLIKKGININIIDIYNKTFLDYLAFNPFLNE